MRRVSFFLGVTVFSIALQAGAQGKSGGNRAAAEALFNQGRDLMTAGKFAEACPKFEASQQLDPGLGTMLNLAECYEKTGRTASAWAEYREAIPLARAAGSKARLDLATERAQALQDRLSTLTIRAMSGDDEGVHLEVRRDGVALQEAELGSPIPVDPGEHVVEAVAPGKQPWTSKVQVGGDAAKVSVEIPKLQASGEPAAANTATGATVTTDPGNSPPPSDTPSGSAQRTTGLVFGGVGVVGLGLGTFFGLQASSKWSDAKAKCTDYPYGCGAEGADLRSSAHSGATVSTVAFVAGGALLATGVVLYLTAPSKKQTVALSIGPSSAFVQGSF
ncbi:MAG: tetratricopeptide repeat protein [Myxococcales bacterium]